MSEVVIFGAGDIARLAHFYFENDSEHTVVAFTVDAQYRNADSFLGLPLIDFEEVTKKFPPSRVKMFVALSYAKINRARAHTYGRAKELGYELVSYVSTRCSYLSKTPPGDNCFILEDNTVQPFVTIGNNVTLWSGNHIGHDSTIEDNCFLASHIVVSGHCTVKRGAFIGVNATLRNGITIAPESCIGAGAVVMKDTVEKGVYLPERAKLFPKKSDEIDL